MTKPHAFPEPRYNSPDELSGYNDLFGTGHPLVNRARQVLREAFDKPQYNGMDGAENGPEIYPAYEAAGRFGDGASCDVCSQAKADCTCWSW